MVGLTTAASRREASARPGPWRTLAEAIRVLGHGADASVAWRLGASLLLTAGGSLLAGLAPLALKEMIDAIAAGPQRVGWKAIYPAPAFGAAYVLALCGGRLLAELRPLAFGAAEQRLYAALRGRFFRHLLALPLSFHSANPGGRLTQCLHQAVIGYQIAVFSLVNGVVPVLFELMTVAVVLMSLGQPALTASFACTALAYFAVLGLRRSGIGACARSVSDAGIETQAILADSLLNIETIKSFTVDAPMCARFAGANRALEQRWGNLRQARLRMGATVGATFALSTAGSLAVALDAVMSGTLSVGGFVLANVYMLQLARPLESLGAAARDLSQALAFIGPLMDVLRERTETPDPHPIAESMESRNTLAAHRSRARIEAPPAIGFEGIHLAYGRGTAVLRGLDLEIAPARHVAIVGASGSGKSSLVRLMLRLCEPQAGQLRLNGQAVVCLPLDHVRSQFALVSQDTAMFNATIGFNIGIGKAGATRFEIERAARLAGVHGFIGSLPEGYETEVGERGLRLSGGERQRIAIARALLKDAPVLLLDEATSMMDSLTEAAILERLKASCVGRTTITIAHRLSTIREADEIVVLARGQVVERGKHGALIQTDGTYAAMWRAQHDEGGIAPVFGHREHRRTQAQCKTPCPPRP